MPKITELKDAILSLIKVTDESGGAEARIYLGWKWLPKNWRAGIVVSWDEGYKANGENCADDSEAPDAKA